MTQEPSLIRQVLVCQSKTCRKQGASRVLAGFQMNAVPNVVVQGCGCLGQCGNGPMVLVLPDQVWYGRVHPDEVLTVVRQHLQDSRPVSAMLYSKFHSDAGKVIP